MARDAETDILELIATLAQLPPEDRREVFSLIRDLSDRRDRPRAAAPPAGRPRSGT